jgi:hypothetical protein
MQTKPTARPYGVGFAQTPLNAKPPRSAILMDLEKRNSPVDKRRAYSAAKTKPKNTTAPASAPVLVDDAAPVYCGVAGPEGVASDGTTGSVVADRLAESVDPTW